MGHSKSQMGAYDHTPKEEDIRILKEQAFNIEVSPEKKHELEIKVDEQDKEIKKMKNQMNEMLELVDKMTKTVSKHK